MAALGLRFCARGLLFVAVRRLLIAVASLVVAHRLSCCAACRDLPQTRDRTCVPCIGRRILNHCATREVPNL